MRKNASVNLEQANDIVMHANTQEKIERALDFFKYPMSHGFELEMSNYQQSMMIEQLNLNACNLSAHGHI